MEIDWQQILEHNGPAVWRTVRSLAGNEAGKMTWNVTWDGASGPIATEWGIRNFPSVFLFDADNKLLASDLPAEYLEEGVKALLNQQSN